MIGIIAVLVAIFLPWYIVSVDVEGGEYETDGVQDIITISPFGGASVTLPTNISGNQSSDAEMVEGQIPLSYLPLLPFTIFYGITAVVALLRALLSKKTQKRAKRLIRGGIVRYLPFILLIVIITQLPYLADRFVGADAIPEQIGTIIRQIAASPLGGEYHGEVEGWESATLFWGLGLGGWLLMIGPALEIVGGAIDRIVQKDR